MLFRSDDTRSGMFYFGHQLGLDYLYHYANVAELDGDGQPTEIPQTTLLSKEQSFSYSLLAGTRLMKDADLMQPRAAKDKVGRGLTFDLFLGVGIGYRVVNPQYEPEPLHDSVMNQIDQSRLHVPFYVGTTIGYVF